LRSDGELNDVGIDFDTPTLSPRNYRGPVNVSEDSFRRSFPLLPAAATPANTAASSDGGSFAQSGQDRRLTFINASVDRRITTPDRLVHPVSPFVVQAETVIPAALITRIRSDLLGAVAMGRLHLTRVPAFERTICSPSCLSDQMSQEPLQLPAFRLTQRC
jgi:type IV secretory pathway VirB10-like protein